MAKLVLNDLNNLQNETSATNKINENSARIIDAVQDTISRSGLSPNAMQADFDMNSHRILNLPQANAVGQPVVFGLDVLAPTFFVQNDAPDTDEVEGSLWIDANSTDYDLYQLVNEVWTDTGLNVRGIQGIQGEPGDLSGDTGAVDNAIIRADGAGGSTVQSSAVTIADTTGDITTPGFVACEEVRILDSNASHHLVIDTSSDLAANRTLTLVPGDADRTLTITADSSIGGTAAVLAGGQTLTGGFATTSDDEGTKTTGTFTPTFTDGNIKRYINGGAHTLAPPSGEGTMIIQVTNNASAGAVTTSGFTKVSGDLITTTNGHDFHFFITIINAFSHLYVQALQ